jgi:sorbitol-specific phosphotransferase system component IIBC
MKKYIKTLNRSRTSRGVKPLRKPIEDKNNPSGFKKRNKTLNKSNTNNQNNQNTQNKKPNENNTNVKNTNKKDTKGKK